MEEGCKTRFISCLASADHKSTVTRKKDQSISLVEGSLNNGWVRSDRDGSLDVDHRVVLMSDHHFDDGGRGQRTPILKEREKK